jgi:CDP-diacylglycerol--glycerol-3-phosphate 3-phosphatidyltransferase
MVLATSLVEGKLGPVAALLVVSRDVAVLIGSATVTLTRGRDSLKQMPPRLLGKLATVAQFALIVSLAGYAPAVRYLLAPTVVLSVWAGIDYVVSFGSPFKDATYDARV